MKLAPSKNPEKESKQFAIIALVCGVLSLLIWPFAVAGLGTGVRGIILSKRVKNTKYLIFSIVGLVLSLLNFAWYLSRS